MSDSQRHEDVRTMSISPINQEEARVSVVEEEESWIVGMGSEPL